MNYDLYVITDEATAGGLTHAEIAERATAGGADVIQSNTRPAGAGNSAGLGGNSARSR